MGEQQVMHPVETRSTEPPKDRPALVAVDCSECGDRSIPVLRGATVRCKNCGHWQETSD